MSHLICRVRQFEIVAPYTLLTGFDDGSEQMIDFLLVLGGELYGPLRDRVVFNQVAPRLATIWGCFRRDGTPVGCCAGMTRLDLRSFRLATISVG